MEVQMKGWKKFTGHDGDGFEASVYVDGKRTVLVVDHAYGGEFDYHIFDQERFDALEAKVKSLPALESDYVMEDGDPMMLDMDLDLWIGEYLCPLAEYAKARKPMTLGPDGKYYTWSGTYKKADRERLLRQMSQSEKSIGHRLLNGRPAIVELE